MPRHRWQDQQPNVEVGDVGFLLYTSKFGKPTWRAARVLVLHPDKHGVVRTVTVGLKRRSKDDRSVKYKPRPPSEMTIPVQRLAVTIPAA